MLPGEWCGFGTVGLGADGACEGTHRSGEWQVWYVDECGLTDHVQRFEVRSVSALLNSWDGGLDFIRWTGNRRNMFSFEGQY